MALTRPNFENILTNTAIFTDSVTVLHGGATQANADIGFLFNRASGLVPNAAFYWSESTQSFITSLTANAGVNNANLSVQSYANLTVGNLLLIQGSLIGVIGNISLGGVNAPTIGNTGAQGIFGNVNSANVIASTGVYSPAYYYANGTPFVSSTYGNTQVLANLAATNNPITIGSNLTTSANLTISSNMFFTSGVKGLFSPDTGSRLTFGMQDGNGSIYGAYFSVFGNNYSDSTQRGSAQFITDTRNSATAGFTVGRYNGSSWTTDLQVDVSGNIVINGTTASTSTTTGILQVAGGVGIAGNLYVGGNITYGSATVSDISSTIISIGTGAVAIDSFANTTIRSAKYVISTQDVTNSWSQATEILLAQDGANVNIVTYGILYTGPSQRMTFSANMTSGIIRLWATGASTNNTVKYVRTGIPL